MNNLKCKECDQVIAEGERIQKFLLGGYAHYPSCKKAEEAKELPTATEEKTCKVCDQSIPNKEIWLDKEYNFYHKECLPNDIQLMGEEAKEDKVAHPSHYNQGGIECIDALEVATANLKGIEAFDTANAIKYLWRWKDKNGVEDLEKAKWYINHMIDRLK